MNILFLCVANSARSQMAEGLARKILGPDFHIQSAGSLPGTISGYAVRAMKQSGIDISAQKSKGIKQIDLTKIDIVITLCRDDVCPPLQAGTKRLHWPVPDPTGQGVSDEDELKHFASVRDLLREKIEAFAQGINDKTSI